MLSRLLSLLAPCFAAVSASALTVAYTFEGTITDAFGFPNAGLMFGDTFTVDLVISDELLSDADASSASWAFPGFTATFFNGSVVSFETGNFFEVAGVDQDQWSAFGVHVTEDTAGLLFQDYTPIDEFGFPGEAIPTVLYAIHLIFLDADAALFSQSPPEFLPLSLTDFEAMEFAFGSFRYFDPASGSDPAGAFIGFSLVPLSAEVIVPEPAHFAAGLGLAALAVTIYRRRR